MSLVIRRTFILFLLAVFMAGSFIAPDLEARSKSSGTGAKGKAPKKQAYVVSAKSAILMELGSGRKVYGKQMTRKVLPASTTKVLTAILVLEKLRLDDYVTISRKAAATLPSKIYADEGDRYLVRDLLYAILLKSANDASVALAEAVAGSEAKFVQMMNRKAWWIGARSTLFANSHGLPDDDPQYSTAYDMALILREAMKKPFFREAIETKFKKIVSKKGKVTLLRTHNKALFQGWKQNVYGKTGYTNAARACFLGYYKKAKKTYIIAVFGCSKRWDDVKYIAEHYGGFDL